DDQVLHVRSPSKVRGGGCVLASASAVGVDHVDPHPAAADGGHDRAQRRRGPTATADDLAQVVGVDVDLDGAAATAAHHVDVDVLGVADDAADQVVDGVGDGLDVHLSASPSVSAASAVSASAASSFFAFFFGVIASVAGAFSASASAAWKRSSLLCFSSRVFRVPSAPGSPLNFCQSPVTLSRPTTGSVGCAPTDSQYCTRSESTSIRLGSSFG